MSMYSAKSWSETKAELRLCMNRWGVDHWDIECETTQYSRAGLSDQQRSVTVWYVHPETGEEKRLTLDKWSSPMENLRALYIALNEIRLNETVRGLGEVFRQNYALLAAPQRVRDPFEVLGLRPDADEDAIDAVYRAKAKRLHPDAGGSAEAFRELQAAYEAVKA